MKRYTLIAILAMLGSFGFQASARGVVRDSLDFDKAMSTSPATLLQGKVSGVRVSNIDGNVNGALNTTIRGINSLRGDNQPLWIIDGVQVNASLNENNNAFFQYGEVSYTSQLNALAFINPYDIESIEVIKDLSAATVYGSKGANGVIIVNTKMPAKGLFNIDWNSNVGFPGGTLGSSVKDSGAKGVSHNHHISLNGASANGQTRYNVSAFFRDVRGGISGNNSRFGGLRGQFDTHANSVVWFGMDATFTIGDMASIAGTSYFRQPSLILAMRKDGFFPDDIRAGWAADYNDDAHDRRGTAGMYLTLNFTPTLSLKTSVGLDFQNNNRYIWYGNGTSFGFASNGAASILGTSIFKYNGKSVLSWTRGFGQNHKITVNGGVEVNGDMTKYNTLNGTDFFSHVLRAKGLNLSGSKATLLKYDHDYFTWGFFADASYSFDGIAGIKAIIRADNTPRYDDKKFSLYKGGEVFFDIKEAFFSNYDIVSALKLKAGYGEAGREKYVPYRMYGNVVPGDYPLVDSQYEAYYEGFNRIRSREFNVGLELGLFSSILNIGFGYYDKTTVDTFWSYCFGGLNEGALYLWSFQKRKEDFSRRSTIANRGFEGDFTVNIFNRRDIKWSVSANGAYNVNQMLQVDAAEMFGTSVGSNTCVNANAPGQTVGAHYGYKTGADGKIVDLNGNSVIDEFDQTIIGNPIPKFFGGINTSFRYKNFTAEIFTDGAWGFDILNLNDVLFDEADKITDKYVEKGDFFSVRRLSVGYDIPFREKFFIKGIKVTASALNLLTFTKYSGWNPDVNSFGNSALSSGVDYGSYPAVRSFVIGVGLNF